MKEEKIGAELESWPEYSYMPTKHPLYKRAAIKYVLRSRVDPECSLCNM